MSLQELKQMYPWPQERPDFKYDLGDVWFADGHVRTLKPLVNIYTDVILELGSWLGRSTEWFASSRPGVEVIAVDTWKGSHEHHRDKRWSKLLPTLKDRFVANMWESRERITPVQHTTLEGMDLIHSLGITPNLIYVDAAHDTKSVEADITKAITLWPTAKIAGDDWNWKTVRKAVESCAVEFRRTIQSSGNVWYYL